MDVTPQVLPEEEQNEKNPKVLWKCLPTDVQYLYDEAQ
jgi:hypothetical protein